MDEKKKGKIRKAVYTGYFGKAMYDQVFRQNLPGLSVSGPSAIRKIWQVPKEILNTPTKVLANCTTELSIYSSTGKSRATLRFAKTLDDMYTEEKIKGSDKKTIQKKLWGEAAYQVGKNKVANRVGQAAAKYSIKGIKGTSYDTRAFVSMAAYAGANLLTLKGVDAMRARLQKSVGDYKANREEGMSLGEALRRMKGK